MAKYITKLYDRIDKICHAYYGTANNKTVEFVLNANPGLERHGFLLPEGVTVDLPDRPQVAREVPTIRLVKLWN